MAVLQVGGSSGTCAILLAQRVPWCVKQIRQKHETGLPPSLEFHWGLSVRGFSTGLLSLLVPCLGQAEHWDLTARDPYIGICATILTSTSRLCDTLTAGQRETKEARRTEKVRRMLLVCGARINHLSREKAHS